MRENLCNFWGRRQALYAVAARRPVHAYIKNNPKTPPTTTTNQTNYNQTPQHPNKLNKQTIQQTGTPPRQKTKDKKHNKNCMSFYIVSPPGAVRDRPSKIFKSFQVGERELPLRTRPLSFGQK